MSNQFNPFTPPAAPSNATAPVQANAPAQVNRKIASDLDDASMYDGFTTPFFKHVDGEFDVKVTGYSGARTEKLGRACHISFEVIKSSKPDAVPVGTTWRVAYKYDFERSEKSDLDTYGTEARTLGLFVQALFGQKASPTFSVKAAEQSLHKHDWATAPGYVHLSATLGKPKQDKSGTTRQYRNDLWLPVKAA